MLKTTHRPAFNAPPLPEGWTEHRAPSGHTYYYNAATKTSTYTRPSAPSTVTPQSASPLQPNIPLSAQGFGLSNGYANQYPNVAPNDLQNFHNGHRGLDHFKREPKPEPQDRPKSKQAIPNCSPWYLVRTKLGRRFVYNSELEESFWKFPSDVLKCVVELDRKERERKERRERGEPSESEEEEKKQDVAKAEKDYDSDEFEEVEVTDDEDGESGNKRLKFEDDKPQGPLEFNEDDIAYQLALMGQDGGDDYAEQDGDIGDDFEEPPLNEEDSKALFVDLLDDFHVNPYTPWEKIIEEGVIIDDSRYTCLPTMKARREVFDDWSRHRMQQLKEQREKQEKKDPRIAYYAFLENNGTPKLYWPEFKRKYKKEAEMRDSKLSDKDREKAYRDYINRLKLPLQTQKSDLRSLLTSQPLHLLNRSTSLSALPTSILADLRYTSIRFADRDPLIEAYIALQPPAPEELEGGASAEEAAEAARLKGEREKRNAALRERERKVEEEKRRRVGKERISRGLLRDGEEEIKAAMGARKRGLLGHFEEEEKEKERVEEAKNEVKGEEIEMVE